MKYPENLLQAVDYLLQHSPSLRRGDISYPKDQGSNHFTMFVKKDRVLRIPRNERDIKLYLSREVEILNHLEGKVSFDIPKVLDYDETKGILCLSKVHGRAVSYDTVNGYSGKKKQEMGEVLGKILAEMAMVNIPECSRQGWSYREDEVPLFEGFTAAAKGIDLNNVLEEDREKIEKAIRYIESKVLEDVPVCLSHFDFYLDHILFQGKTPIGLIDFDAARLDVLLREGILYTNGKSPFAKEIVSSARDKFSNMTGIELDQSFWPHANVLALEHLRQKMLPRVV